MHAPAGFRVGHGYDSHRLTTSDDGSSDSPLIVGGVVVDSTIRVIAHSDGDALFHAVTDALLGAIGQPDIGMLFPDTDPRHRAQNSVVFLEEAAHRVVRAGYTISNIDATIILQRPRLAPLKTRICENLAAACSLETDRVNIKCKTAEGLDAVGEGRAIVAFALCLLERSG